LVFVGCLTFCLISKAAQVTNEGSLQGIPIDYVVKATANSKNHAIIEITIRNKTDRTLYIRAEDAPWVDVGVFFVSFASDLDKKKEPKSWESSIAVVDDGPFSVLKSTELKAKGEITRTILIGHEYPAVDRVRDESNVYSNWNFIFRAYSENPDKGPHKNTIEPAVNERIGGFLVFPKNIP
jgi:hypothetical protein